MFIHHMRALKINTKYLHIKYIIIYSNYDFLVCLDCAFNQLYHIYTIKIYNSSSINNIRIFVLYWQFYDTITGFGPLIPHEHNQPLAKIST